MFVEIGTHNYYTCAAGKNVNKEIVMLAEIQKFECELNGKRQERFNGFALQWMAPGRNMGLASLTSADKGRVSKEFIEEIRLTLKLDTSS